MTLSGGLDRGRFTIEIEGEVQLDRAISRWSQAMSDFTGFFSAAERFLAAAVTGQLQSQGSRGGSTWAPLSPRYAQYKLRRFGAKPILEASGDMKDSFGRISLTTSELVWGTRLAYPKYHQRGATHLPQRKIFALTDEDRRAMMKELQRQVMSRGSEGVVRV